METTTILTADVLDIIFEGRNKLYGAYELRKTYHRRLTLSITVMLSAILLACVGAALGGKQTVLAKEVILPPDVTLEDHKPPVKEELLPPPPPRAAAAAPAVQTVKNLVPVIVPADQVKPEDMPPATDELEKARIGNMIKNGQEDDGAALRPSENTGNGTGLIELPRKYDEDEDRILLKVEIESEYPGGPAAWQRFLNRNFRYPTAAFDDGVQGSVLVQFVVDKDGNVSEVVAISGPEELRAEAVRVIKKSGKWTPAIQNSHPVKSYKRQPISFKISGE
jgi:periplasmic protein TonB